MSSIEPSSAGDPDAVSRALRSRKLGAVVAVVAYFAFVHFALAQGWSRAALAALVVLVCAGLTQRARTPTRKWLTAAAGTILLLALAALPESRRLEWVIFLPPLLINGVLCYGFGRTLVRGRVPMATAFARHARGGSLPADLVDYTRQITIAWTLFFAAMLAIAAALTAFASLAAWSWFANFANPLLVGAFFLCEYGWRRHRFPHHPHSSLADMLHYLRMPSVDAPAQPVAAIKGRSMLPLLRLHRANDPVAWHHGQAVSAADLIDAATALAKELPPQRHVLNLCRDRYCFVVGFTAAMIARRVTLLPSSHGEAAIRDICRAFPDVCCLADHDEVPAGIDTRKVRAGYRVEDTQTGERMARAEQGSASAASAGCADLPAQLAFPGEQQAAVIFTSGSTGTPTPHSKTWASLVGGALTLGEHLGMAVPATAQSPTCSLRPSIVGTVPPQHMFGLETTVMLPLQWRGAFGAGRPLLPADIKAAIQALPAPRWLMTTPLHLDACVKERIDLTGTLSGVISSTMPLAEKLALSAEALCGCAIEEIYGSTETGMIAMRRTASGPAWTLCEGLSMSLEGQSTRIQGGHVEPPFIICDRIEAAGARSFILLGRAGDLIKVAGKRASLEALNTLLRAVPGVADGVFYIPPSGGDATGRPVAFAVAPDTTAAAILAALRRDLDPVFLPRPLYLVAALPRADNGKITQEGLAALLHRAKTGRDHSVSKV